MTSSASTGHFCCDDGAARNLADLAQPHVIETADDDGVVLDGGLVGNPHQVADDEAFVGMVFDVFGPVGRE